MNLNIHGEIPFINIKKFTMKNKQRDESLINNNKGPEVNSELVLNKIKQKNSESLSKGIR